MTVVLKRPMLAAKAVKGDHDALFKLLTFPMLASPKLDGIRAMVRSSVPGTEVLLSRKLKPIPNRHTQALLSHGGLHGLDGELIFGKPNAEDVYRMTDSAVMTHAGEPDVKFYVFDDWSSDDAYATRYKATRKRVHDLIDEGFPLKWVTHRVIHNVEELLEYEEKCLDHGYEGVMLRSFGGLYKQGRSTLSQMWLVKIKRTEDFEAQIVDSYELKHNDNAATINELGYTKRSSHKANKRGGGTLGGFVMRRKDGVQFRCGGGQGLTAKLRAELWAVRETLPGKWCTVQSLPIGVKNLPRHPQVKEIEGFLRFRNELDMDDE